MLRKTFLHLPGISRSREAALWKRGILDWDELAHECRANPSALAGNNVLRAIETSEEAYLRGDLRFFHQFLPKQDQWRIVPDFIDRAACLDIETTGAGMPPASYSTVICFYYRGSVFQEADPAAKRRLVQEVLADCSFLVSYFGTGFDVPFLRREMALEIDSAHIDLCFWLRRLGFKGGLKKVQKAFPEIPARSSMELDGFDAVRLWQLHRKGVPGALETLYTYNAEDTIVLDPLLRTAFNLQISKMEMADRLALSPLPVNELPGLRTGVDHHIYSLLKDPDSSFRDAFSMA